VLLNDPAFIEASRCLASRILTDSKTAPQRLALAFSEVLARSAEPRELAVLERLLQQQMQSFRDAPLRAQQLVDVGDAPVAEHVDVIELAAWTTVISSLMNLDEFVNKP
jgi:hypothetical protein